ncbi:MAG: helix-turn-helix domain-containing protein [Halobacteria archaeon]|nr:helix-turn-helix domain-containing protein [Halobacteria archaeon]
MSSIFGSESETELSSEQDGEPRVMGVDSEDAETLINALSSATSREILAEIHDSPSTPSEIAAETDTTVQNARYHLGKLQDADLIRVADTKYSEKGREMSIYAPSEEPLLVFVGREDDSSTSGIKDALKSIFAAILGLGVVSLGVEWVVESQTSAPAPTPEDTGSSGGGGVGIQSTEQLQAETAQQASQTVPPGVLFFAGGVVVLLGVFAWWYLRKK